MGRQGPRGGFLTTFALVGAGVLGLTACGADVERTEAAGVADAFEAAEVTDPSAACGRLAPRALEAVEEDGADCPVALADVGLPEAGARVSVVVAGHSAQVRYSGDTVFLARFDDGWRVTAAGCRRVSTDPAVPYDCAVDGG